jgi:sugar phosphate isomerase/epimerase
MSIDRRSFLAALPGATIAARYMGDAGQSDAHSFSESILGSATAQPRVLDNVGVQVYTLRAEMSADVERTLAAVAEIGYTEVELFGPYSLRGREMRGILDSVGLRATSSHVDIGAVRRTWAETLESAQELGQALVVVPSLPGDARNPESLRGIADEFNRAGEMAQAAGIRFGYHNHQWEVVPGTDGVRPIDILLENTDPALVDWQMDIFWTVDGDADPLAELEQYSGRIKSVHVKDRSASGEMVDVGDGIIDFRTILGRAEEGGLLHQFVEHDSPGDALESVRASFAAVKALRG